MRGFGAAPPPPNPAVLKCRLAAVERAKDFEKLQITAVVGSLVALAVGVGVGVGIKKAGWV